MRIRISDAATGLIIVAAIAIAVADRTLVDERVMAFADSVLRERAIARHWNQISAAATPAWHAVDSGPLVVELLQYSCEGCIEAAPSVRASTSARARLALLHVPPSADSVAIKGAALTICAARVGAGAQMHDFLSATQQWRLDPAERSVRQVIHADYALDVSECLQRTDTWQPVLVEHRRVARALRLRYTPFLFGKSGSAVPSSEGVDSLIVRESREAAPGRGP